MNIPSVLKGKRLRLFVRLVANGFGQALFTVSTVLLVKLAFDRLITKNPSEPLSLMVWVGLGLVTIAGSMAWLRMMERIDAEKMGQDYTHRIRMTLFDHLSKLAPRAIQKRSRGAIVLRFVGDLNSLRKWVSLGLVRVTVATVTAFGALLVLSIVNWVLALGVAVVLAAGVLQTLTLGKRMRDAVKESRRRRSYLAANVNEKVSSMAVVQVFGQADREQKRLGKQSRRLKNAMIAQARQIGLMRAITQSTTTLACGVVLLLGVNQVASGRATPGTIVAAITIVGLLVPALRDLGRVYEYWQEAQVALQKIGQFLSTPSLVSEGRNAPDLKPGPGRLEFRNVKLSGSLYGISAIAEPGKVIALVGPNGAGKSTLLTLAARLIDPDKGRVLLDGQNIAKYSLASTRRAIGMMSPDLPLLRGTIDKNIRYRWPDAPEEEVERVKKLCEIDKVVSELSDGDGTRLTEGGENLSLGQRQRIALARSLLGNPALLLLDEADAHMDQSTGMLLDSILSEYRGTVLQVTHNADRLARADIVWCIRNGRLVDESYSENKRERREIKEVIMS
jgi:ABC-type multidrug transport system fused ATPase/permease subunit